MVWLIGILASLACGILNPHIGLFSVFVAVQGLIMFCFYVAGRSRFHMAKICDANYDYQRGERIRKTGKAMLTGACVVGGILFVVSSVVGVIVWMLSSGMFNGNVLDVPFDILNVRNDKGVCALLTGMMVFFNLLGVILLIFSQLRIRKSGTEPLRPDQIGARDITGLKVSLPTILSIVISTILGFLNPYFGWLTFIHLFYFLAVLIIAVILASYRAMARQPGYVGYTARHLLLQMSSGGGYNKIMQVCVWAIAIGMTALAAMTTNMQVCFWNGAALNLGAYSWLPMAAAELLTAVSFVVDAQKIHAL